MPRVKVFRIKGFNVARDSTKRFEVVFQIGHEDREIRVLGTCIYPVGQFDHSPPSNHDAAERIWGMLVADLKDLAPQLAEVEVDWKPSQSPVDHYG